MRKVIGSLALSLVSIFASSQEGVLEKKIAVEFDQTAIPEVLETLAERYDFGLVYQPDALAAIQPVSGYYEGDLDGFLNNVFSNTPVHVLESHRQIILRTVPEEIHDAAVEAKEEINFPFMQPIGPDEAQIDIPALGLTRPSEVRKVMADTVENGRSYKGYPQRPVHVGIIFPISTNGVDARKFANIASFHLIGGVSAGVNGIAMSGITNYDRNFVDGVQLAGIVNITEGKVQGIQMGGIANIAGSGVSGLQAAGIANISGDSVLAGQFAGIANVNDGYVAGGQFAGIANVNTASADGVSAAGIVNVTPDHHRGLMLGGIANYSSSMQGAQIAGIANVAHESAHGFQLAGIVNVAGNVKGSQLALFNVADSVSGVPIGLLSFVRHGYRRVEMSGSEALHAQLAFKIGVQKFYNILALGFHFSGADPLEYGDEPTWAYGYGIGSEFNLGKTWRMNLDLTTFDVIEKENTFQHKKLNLLNQFRLNFGAQVGGTLTIAFGPSFNVMVSQLEGNDIGTFGSDLPPYTVYDQTHNGTNVKMWPGFDLAIRF